MSNKINVKISVPILRETIEAKIKKIKADLANYKKNYPALIDKYEKDSKAHLEAYREAVSKYLTENHKKIIENITFDAYSSSNPKIRIDLDNYPKPPQRPESISSFESRNNVTLKELEQALALLKMTTQEEVSSSNYINIMPLIMN